MLYSIYYFFKAETLRRISKEWNEACDWSFQLSILGFLPYPRPPSPLPFNFSHLLPLAESSIGPISAHAPDPFLFSRRSYLPTLRRSLVLSPFWDYMNLKPTFIPWFGFLSFFFEDLGVAGNSRLRMRLLLLLLHRFFSFLRFCSNFACDSRLYLIVADLPSLIWFFPNDLARMQGVIPMRLIRKQGVRRTCNQNVKNRCNIVVSDGWICCQVSSRWSERSTDFPKYS